MKPPTQRTADVLNITLTFSGNAATRFLPLLGEGMVLQGRGGATVEDFLVEAAGISAAYLKERVQTVFLDGRALDDFSVARVGDGATLALSAAMPGLAGAVLRRGGIYASLRREISHQAHASGGAAGEIRVTLKLFNLIAREQGPALLRRGILISGARWCDFVRRQGRWAWDGCRAAEADGAPVGFDQLIELGARRPWVRLCVHSAG
jgi:hypothetical protein